MTTSEKINKVKSDMQDVSDKDAKKIVSTVNWLQKWDNILELMRSEYIADSGTNISKMEFNMYIFENCKNLPSQYQKNLINNN